MKSSQKNLSRDVIVYSENLPKELCNWIESALKHWGMPYRWLHTQKALFSVLSNKGAACLLLFKDPKCFDGLAKIIDEDVGIVWFSYGSPGLASGATPTVRINNQHWITKLHDKEEIVCFTSLVPADTKKINSQSKTVLLQTEGGTDAMVIYQEGKRRVVHWALSPYLWNPQVLGFGCDLDDIFWRGIIWAAKKPFAMRALPPFVTFRIDDVGNHQPEHYYLDSLKKYGYIPHVSINIDELTDEIAADLAQRQNRAEIDCSVHAFSTKHLCYVSKDGQEYDDEEIKENFSKIDKALKHWGIHHSQVLVPHNYGMGKKDLPYLKERGINTLATILPFNRIWTAVRDLRELSPEPYKHCGFAIHPMSETAEFFNVYAMSPYRNYVCQRTGDFLATCSTHNPIPIEVFAQRMAYDIRLGLQTLFFGCPVTHESRIAKLRCKQWEQILQRVRELTSGFSFTLASYDKIAQYARNYYTSSLEEVSYSTERKELFCVFKGKSCIKMQVTVFQDCQEKIKSEIVNVDAFKKRLLLKIHLCKSSENESLEGIKK